MSDLDDQINQKMSRYSRAADTEWGSPAPAPSKPAEPAPTRPEASPQPAPSAPSHAARPSQASMWSAGESMRNSDMSSTFTSSTEVTSGKKDLAEHGFLGFLNRVFHTQFARTAYEMDYDQWVSAINTILRYPKVVAVVSPNGSTGKSSTTQMLGSTIAHERTTGAGVVGVDIDASSILVTRMRPATRQSQRHSVAEFADSVKSGEITTGPDVSSSLVANEDRFGVLPGVGHTGDPNIGTDDLLVAVNKLAEFNDLILLDFPGSREVPVAEEALRWVDAMVFVVDTNKTSLDSGYHMLKQLKSAGSHLLDNCIVILNNRSGGKILPDLNTAIATIRQNINAGEDDPRVFQVAHDSHIYESGEMERSKTADYTQRRFVEMSAALMGVLPADSEPRFRRYMEKRSHS